MHALKLAVLQKTELVLMHTAPASEEVSWSKFPRIRKTSLMAEFLDPAYLRQHLCFWLLDKMGMPSPFFYPVRAQMNGAFSLALGISGLAAYHVGRHIDRQGGPVGRIVAVVGRERSVYPYLHPGASFAGGVHALEAIVIAGRPQWVGACRLTSTAAHFLP